MLGILKFDCLALGMLTAIRKSFDLLGNLRVKNIKFQMSRRTKNFSMIKKADTLGVFQIESRAQMAMLPRLKQRVFMI